MKSHAVLALLGFMLGISQAFPMREDYLGASRREVRKRENHLGQHHRKRYMETSLSHHLMESEDNLAPRRFNQRLRQDEGRYQPGYYVQNERLVNKEDGKHRKSKPVALDYLRDEGEGEENESGEGEENESGEETESGEGEEGGEGKEGGEGNQGGEDDELRNLMTVNRHHDFPGKIRPSFRKGRPFRLTKYL